MSVGKVRASAAGQFWQQMCVRLQVCYFGNGNDVFQEFAEFLLGAEEYIHLVFSLFFPNVFRRAIILPKPHGT